MEGRDCGLNNVCRARAALRSWFNRTRTQAGFRQTIFGGWEWSTRFAAAVWPVPTRWRSRGRYNSRSGNRCVLGRMDTGAQGLAGRSNGGVEIRVRRADRRSSRWLTRPVTHANNPTHLLSCMVNQYHSGSASTGPDKICRPTDLRTHLREGSRGRVRAIEGAVSILRQSRRLYDCWPLKGA